MTVRIRHPDPAFFNRIGTVERKSESGGWWVRIEGEWPAGEANAFDGLQWFEVWECEVIAARAAA